MSLTVWRPQAAGFRLDVAQWVVWFDFLFVEKLRAILIVLGGFVFNPVWSVSQYTFPKHLDCFSISLRGTEKGGRGRKERMYLVQFVMLSGLLWLKRKTFAVQVRQEGTSFFSFGYSLEKVCLTTNIDGNYRQGGRIPLPMLSTRSELKSWSNLFL